MIKKVFIALLVLFPLMLVAQEKIHFSSELMLRYDRQEFPQSPVPRETVERYRIQWRPSLLFFLTPSLELGLQAEANWIDESDEDIQPPRFPEFHTPVFDRDNFRRDAVVLSGAFLKYEPNPGLQLIGGKFENPFFVSELVWDNDLHPNGAALTVAHDSAEGTYRIFGRIGDFYASHYQHDRTNVLALQGGAQISSGPARFTFTASYYDHEVDDLDIPLLRTNSRIGSELMNDYNVVDLIARVRLNYAVPLTAQIDYAINTAADEFIPNLAGSGDQGYLIDVIAGQIQEPFGFRIGFAYHRVESDAVLAAYNTDEWWFPTRGEGYRIHGSIKPWNPVTFHLSYLNQTLIGQDAEFERWLFTTDINWP